jgi:acetoin utilization deacetylase AcuC-like enzyme
VAIVVQHGSSLRNLAALARGNMKIYYSESHRTHNPPFEVIDGGQRISYMESPDRVESILAALRGTSWAEILEPAFFGLKPIRAVHANGYLEFLASAWEQWLALYPEKAQASADAVYLPATFALRRHPHLPSSLLGRAGYYMMDLSAVIVDGTYEAALASANCALGAAHAIASDATPERSAFALCRPPGHHAGPDYAGGYCFINNAAVAAQWLSELGTVAVLDVDYHCGNGTEDIFYNRADVLTLSLHADPAAEYPYYAGYREETGEGEGAGFHHNFPLPTGTDDAEYLSTLDSALDIVRRFRPRFLVVSAGMDLYEQDSLGRFKITNSGIEAIGAHIAALQLPTVVIMEGGYNTAALGPNVVSFLQAFTE